MLTKSQFDSLKPGDIVLYNGKPRTIRDKSSSSITFSILHRSWTGRIFTVRGYNDIKHALSLPRKERDRRDVCKAEEESLLANGFDVAKEVDRELAENDRLAGYGMGSCRAAITLLKQTQRKFKRRKQ